MCDTALFLSDFADGFVFVCHIFFFLKKTWQIAGLLLIIKLVNYNLAYLQNKTKKKKIIIFQVATTISILDTSI